MGADCKGFTDWACVSSAEGADSPTFFTASYPQQLSTAGDKPVDSPQRSRAWRPHIVESARVGLYTPQQKIFAKVRSGYAV
jgi:hypothetical protein